MYEIRQSEHKCLILKTEKRQTNMRVRAPVRGQTASVRVGCKKETQAQTRSLTQISLFAFLILGNGDEYFWRNY